MLRDPFSQQDSVTPEDLKPLQHCSEYLTSYIIIVHEVNLETSMGCVVTLYSREAQDCRQVTAQSSCVCMCGAARDVP